VKFNYDACKQMDSILNSESKLKKGMIMVNNNLIDSNMFIRAMVLACDHFLQAGGEMAEFASNSRLMKHFREFEKHVQFVVQLVSILNVTELTQENVSCLNTSLVGGENYAIKTILFHRKHARGKLEDLTHIIR